MVIQLRIYLSFITTIMPFRAYKSPKWDRLHSSYKLCRRLQVYIRMENIAFSRISYISKMVGIISTTLHIFFAIRLIHEVPPEGVANFIMGVIVLGTMLGIYDRAYRVVSVIKELKGQILLSSMGLESPHHRRLLERSIKSIQPEGIRMGGFYCVEREATLITASFIFSQVVSLSVAFRRTK